MLPRTSRLRSSEVAAVLKRGRSIAGGPHVSAKVLSAEGGASGTIRVAAVVSKKVAKTAVMRNRLRRALYDAVRAADVPQVAADVIFFVRAIPPAPIKDVLAAEVGTVLSSRILGTL